ncbi:HutD family protein [Alcaligenaceae bacterium B3P038]|nr:HutD family protein [Alcaligenaceae bacterium B3P038]
MPWISFDATTSATVPWRNGGGTTCELLTLAAADGGNGDVPAGDGAFDARVSLATIAQPGPFSAFPGIDRQITLIDGPGVRLTAENGAFDHRLEQALVPFAFDGGMALDATWAKDSAGSGTAARVLNVMTRRGRCEATVQIVTTSHTARETTPLSNRTVALRIVARGTWRVANSRDDGAIATWTFGQGAYRDSLQTDALSPGSRTPDSSLKDAGSRDAGAFDDLCFTPLTPDAALIAVHITFLAAP